MKVAITIASLGLVGLAAAGPCNNNCGRQVLGTARPSPALSDRRSMCAELLTKTTIVTPPAATVTLPIQLERRNPNVHGPRAPSPVITDEKPTYATNCADVTAYWNACQCFEGFAPTTVTVTAPTPTETLPPSATCTQGLEFALYGVRPDTYQEDYINFYLWQANQRYLDLNALVGGIAPDSVGVTPYTGFKLGEGSDWQQPIGIYGKTGAVGTNLGKSIVNHRGYIVPQKVGTYTITIRDVDDLAMIWIGEAAVSDWTVSTTSVRMDVNFFDQLKTYEIAVAEADLNKHLPIRIMYVNGSQYGRFQVSIVDPEENVILGPDSQKNPQIIASCSGPDAPVGQWAEWATEKPEFVEP
ncbi:hypothetical protein B0I35DRAFT_476287 [Stachybotrys elegans]|uniref:PA14 domain-containing protein n=1 Tax=Stachybotrys elegans TaxID=80388 RepID=A0A8K0T055_9HYPO|nr:hypothetical protein B0I35DRAFT_476287 [Stachybotrys elegans]